jgi:hypothetical protein
MRFGIVSIAVPLDASIRNVLSFCIYGQSMYQGVAQPPCLTPHRPAPFFGASAPDSSLIEMQGFRRSPLIGQPPSQKVIFGRLIDDRCRLFRLHHITAHKDESHPRQIRTAQELRRCCVKKTRERHAVREMKEDPSEPSCRGRLQTAMSCSGRKATVVNVMVKRRDIDHVRYG